MDRIGNAKVYLVGGYVRDTLIGIAPKDRDYLVVGATHDLMIEHGFKQVGAGFPVYLHPETGDEYALARTERKTGPGYKGFVTYSSPEVTVEEDLLRRDLTINSMAIDLTTNRVIDPHGGIRDMQRGWLRHTSEAFREDPLRILRVARFAARYNFKVHKTTRDLMVDMVYKNAMMELVRERVWAEMSRGLMERDPQKMFQVLADCKALSHMAAPWDGGLYADGIWMTGEWSGLNLSQRFALIAGDWSDWQLTEHKIPADHAKLASVFRKSKHQLAVYKSMSADDKLALLGTVGAIGKYRNTTLFEDVQQIYRTWGIERFVGSSLPPSEGIADMKRHANIINHLVPPDDIGSVPDIVTWMKKQRQHIVLI